MTLILVIVGVGSLVIAALLVAIKKMELRTPNTLPRVCLGCAHKQRHTKPGQILYGCRKRLTFPGMYKNCSHKVQHVDLAA